MSVTGNILSEMKGATDLDIVVPSDAGYERARAVWNGCIDRRPAAIIRCRSALDVAEAVGIADERDLPLAVRGGGHSLPGFSTCDDGIVVDLSAMRTVEVEVANRIAHAGGGCCWSDFDAETARYGLATTGGVVSSTGIAGLTLGGGIGWLMNERGLACDNLVGAQVVTADGRIVETSGSEHEDLLWGLRGGGGNFGVVTRLDYQLAPIGDVVGGVAFYPIERAEELARAYREMVGGLSDAFTTMLVIGPAPDEEFVPTEMRGSLSVAIVGCHTGEQRLADAELEHLRKLDPPVDLFETMPYPTMQSLFDAEFPEGGRYYFKGGFLSSFPDEAIAAVMDHMRSRPSPAAEFDLHHMGGAVHRVAEIDTAFSGRFADYTYNVVARWEDPSDDDANREWARSLANMLEPFGHGRSFVSFLSEAADLGSIEAVYGPARYQRLRELKGRYDPNNRFRLNQNIAP